MSKKLHILFLTSWYPSKHSKTAGVFIKRHAECIAKTQKVTVIYPIGASSTESTTLERTIINNVDTLIIYFKRHPNPILNSIRKFKALKVGLVEIEKFDIIHGHVIFPIGPIVWLTSKLYKVPYIITEHWTDYRFPLNKSIGILKKTLSKIVVKNAKKITVVSKTLRNEMLQFGLKGTYEIIGNVINTDVFQLKEKQRTKERFTFLHISNLSDNQKNISGILKVFKRVVAEKENFHLRIIASNNISWLENYINILSIPAQNITIESSKTEKELAKIYQSSDVYISFSNYETFGLVVVEALSTGTPIISTDTGIVREIDSKPYITKVQCNNQEDLYNAMMEQPSKSNKIDIQKMHQLVVENYHPDVIANKFINLYEEILN